MQEGDDYDSIEMVIILQRRPLFTILTVVLPMIILSVMNTFCYLLPIESGEKIGMSVAIFLTFAVFGSVLSDTMPKNSENICRFTVYVHVTTQIFLSYCCNGNNCFASVSQKRNYPITRVCNDNRK